MKVVAYIRVSTEKQAEQGQGLQEQQKLISAYAATHGIIITDWIQDTVSGASDERPGLSSIIDLAKSGQLKTLVITKIDRLARDVSIGEKIFKDLRKLEVDIISVMEKLDNSLAGNLMRQMLLAFAEYEKGTIALRTHPAKRRLVGKTGCFWGGTASIGYKTKGSNKTGINGRGELEVNEQEAKLVKRVFELVKKIGESPKHITQILNVEGYKNRAGNPIQSMTVYRIIQNKRVYEGKDIINDSIPLEKTTSPLQPKILID